MKINYDIICIFLTVFIFYYLLFIISEKYKMIEGQENQASGTGDIMCYGNGQVNNHDAYLDFNKCNDWPFEYKSQASSTKQCLDGSSNCSEESKLRTCCNQRAEMCQGNIDNRYNDWTCTGDKDIPKIDATELPRMCDENNTTDCWNSILRRGNPIGLEGCEDNNSTCNISNLNSDEQKQNICCTNYALYTVAETVWGRPHLLSAANLKFNDYKELKNTDPVGAKKILNQALDHLYQARQLSDDDRSIVETLKDWSREAQIDIGEGMCIGNINPIHDFPCDELNKGYVDNSFIKKGTTSDECCIISGMCANNTNKNEDVECPENTSAIEDVNGSTIEECCEANVKCSENENINENYRCPEPMILKLDAGEIYGNTKEDCCRYETEKNLLEIDPISENETIFGTLIFNGDIMLSVGEKNSFKYLSFINNFKKDLVDIINKGGKISVLEEQIVINNIYSGSIIIDFKIVPENISKISISKEYLMYVLNQGTYFPTLDLHTNGGILNINIRSWNNMNHWPNWIWFVITIVITSLILLFILI
jgi:hypothetical protein